MPYRIVARKPGAKLTYVAATEEAAIAQIIHLRGKGLQCDVYDADDGILFDEADLEDLIEERSKTDT